MSFSVGQRPQSGGKIVRQKERQKETSLKILPSENGQNEREDTWESSGSRPSSGRKSSSSKRAPPIQKSDSYTPRRTPTPSKQVSLQVTKRKESSEDTSFGELDWEEHERLESARLSSGAKPKTTVYSNQMKSKNQKETERKYSKHKCYNSNETESSSDKSAELMLQQCYKKEDVSSLMADMGFAESSSFKPETSVRNTEGYSNTHSSTSRVKDKNEGRRMDIEESDEFDTDLEDGEESSAESEAEEKRRAPDELKMEFLGAVMRQEWPDAQRLCEMILIYEPDHEEANSFKDLIAEKVQLEKELAEESGSDYETDDDEGDSSDDDSDDSEDEDSSDSDDDDDDDEDTEQHQASGHSDNLDSGISSTTDLQERY